MTSNLHRVSRVAFCAIVAVCSSATVARAQADAAAKSQAEALSAAAKASPELAKDLAKELGSTPEQAAGAAGVFFAVAKSFLKPDDFAKLAKAVPGMDALLAAVPAGVVSEPSARPGSTLTPGFSSSSSPPAGMMAANPIGAAIGGLSKLGIKPDMIAKALPFLSDYLKKNGGAALGSLLGGVFKTGK